MTQVLIESLEAIIVDLPTIRPHKLAMHTMQKQTLVILRLRCSDGIEGLGEATTIGGLAYGNESPESIKANLDAHFAPLLIGQDASNINAAMQRLDKAIKGNTFARSAVETALLDAQGKRLGLAVSELLGGRVRDSLEVAWTLASGDTARDIEEAERMLDLRRHRIFKLKIGANPLEQDLKHVVAIKKALGERASVRVDVNQYWDESQAIRGCQVLGENGIDLIEQPISRINRSGQVRLNQRSPAPIMADESIESVEDAFSLAADGARQHLRPEDRQERRPARRAAHRADRRSCRHRPVRRDHARRRRRHPGLGPCLRHPEATDLAHRAVRTAAADRGDRHRGAGLPRLPTDGAERPGPRPEPGRGARQALPPPLIPASRGDIRCCST
ncbi:Muconate cycloisomerase 1 [Pseudomonas knackmussii B13]|uniref:Muconate cycloisomerase 1 n=1 Tax=Pseudomonas knackmussii (strain DSM 6978 / CCUG 54928 / LMG 23759 / B13) TaxID=1301098 RepID=A0A024HG22_PSEKB|nr:Muconate cycloisomerase 1 [Pseudomonas knackmussii B13]